MEKKIITIGNKLITLTIDEFESNIDVDDMLKIDYSNIIGEVLTFSTLVNRLGILVAEIEYAMNVATFDLETFKAEKAESYRKKLTRTEQDAKGGTKTIYPTVAEVDNGVNVDYEFKAKKIALYAIMRDKQIMTSFYWSAKDKSDKLNKLSEKLRPEEFEGDILDGKINGVLIKVRDKLIK